MRDVTAVILSIGEPYTERAIAGVRRQTLPAADCVVVRDVTPFHRALNEGALQVRTPFFVQVDADVILDDDCLATLRALMDERFGLVSGLLRDPIVGRTVGVRLYRTQCFERVRIRDSISPDMDFEHDIRAHGWARLFALRYRDLHPRHWHTVGEHAPHYTPHYTYCKFVLEGVRSRYRRREGRVGLTFRRLRASAHEAANLAFIGVARGLLLAEQRDLLAPYAATAETDRLAAFLAAAGTDDGAPALVADGDERECFRRAAALGRRWGDAGASATFLARLQQLRTHGGRTAWFAAVGLCVGLLLPAEDLDAAHASLHDLLRDGDPW